MFIKNLFKAFAAVMLVGAPAIAVEPSNTQYSPQIETRQGRSLQCDIPAGWSFSDSNNGVDSMAPFTDWPHLKQAFTNVEIWPVDPHRIEAALAEGYITTEQADYFRTSGALGSHLEILERNDCYKGFNQTGINEIIGRTDPRNR